MDWNRLGRTWKRTKFGVQQKWTRLTDDDLEIINGRRDRLEFKILERYGFSPDHIRKEIDDWVRWQVRGSPHLNHSNKTEIASRESQFCRSSTA
jgi:uncharacterized protein YjbJ (UPF0337 family)